MNTIIPADVAQYIFEAAISACDELTVAKVLWVFPQALGRGRAPKSWQDVIFRWAHVKYEGSAKTTRVLGQLHSVGCQSSETCADGTVRWHRCGKLHRDHGPAEMRGNGENIYYDYGVLRRDYDHSDGRDRYCMGRKMFPWEPHPRLCSSTDEEWLATRAWK